MTTSPTTPTLNWTVNSTDPHAWAKEFMRRDLGPEMLELWFKNAMEASRKAQADSDSAAVRGMGGSVLPVLFDDGSAIVCDAIAGGKCYTDGFPDFLSLAVGRPADPASVRRQSYAPAYWAERAKKLHRLLDKVDDIYDLLAGAVQREPGPAVQAQLVDHVRQLGEVVTMIADVVAADGAGELHWTRRPAEVEMSPLQPVDPPPAAAPDVTP